MGDYEELAIFHANRYFQNSKAGEFDDYLQDAREGVLTAMRDFDPTRCVPFKAFLNLSIKHHILDGMYTRSTMGKRIQKRHGHRKSDITFSFTSTQLGEQKFDLWREWIL